MGLFYILFSIKQKARSVYFMLRNIFYTTLFTPLKVLKAPPLNTPTEL